MGSHHKGQEKDLLCRFKLYISKPISILVYDLWMVHITIVAFMIKCWTLHGNHNKFHYCYNGFTSQSINHIDLQLDGAQYDDIFTIIHWLLVGLVYTRHVTRPL